MDDNSIFNRLEREWQDLMAVTSAGPTELPDRFAFEAMSFSVRPVALFAELEDARVSYSEMLEELKPEENGDHFVTKHWTLKDFIAHLGSWATEFRRQVETAIRGEDFDYVIDYALSEVGPNEWNRVQVASRRNLPLETLRHEYETETRKLQDIVLELPQEELEQETSFAISPNGDPSELWKGNIAQIIAMKCLHDRWHIDRLRQWFTSSETLDRWK